MVIMTETCVDGRLFIIPSTIKLEDKKIKQYSLDALLNYRGWIDHYFTTIDNVSIRRNWVIDLSPNDKFFWLTTVYTK